MEFVVVSYFITFLCAIQYSESFNWTVKPADTTIVTKGEDKLLTWKYTLTADEQTKSQTLYLIKWKKFNLLSSDYVLLGSITFLSTIGRPVYDEPRAPHIEISKQDPATLLINNVRREDEGTYKIEYSLELDGTVLADHEVNVTVLEHPEIVPASGNQYVCEGSMITLSCDATGKPAPHITWTRVWENGTDSEELPSVNGHYVIRNISRSSNGTYRCTAFNGVGEPINQTMEVIVGNSAHVVRLVSSSSTIIEGGAYNISCEVSGDPLPNVTWINVSNSQRIDGNILSFTNIDRNDAGDYRCEAKNRCGIDTSTEAIDVFFKAENVTLKMNATNDYGCINMGVNFTCYSAKANPQVHNYMLFRNDSEVSFSEKGTWTERISREETFVYKCVAYQQIGNVSSRNNVTLAVGVPAAMEQVQNVTVKEGTNVTTECKVTTGSPPLTVFWENVKSGQVIEGKLLTITHITRYQTEYRCIAKNTCGSDSSTMFIDVQYKPSATRSSSTIKLELGEDRSIGCPVDIGNPPAAIMWYRGNCTNGNKTTNSSTLEVQNAALSDEEWYTCFAKNELGNTTVNLLLMIVKPVSSTIATLSQTTPTASESTEVYLTATIQKNCSRRSEVAAKFPDVACQVSQRFGCISANSVNTRCGSVVLDFMMRFNQSVVVTHVLTFLSDAARQGKFGVFKVDPSSIKQVLIPTDHDGWESTTRGPEECNCPCNDVMFKAIIGVLAFIILFLLIYIIYLHRKGAVGKQRSYEDDRGVYDNGIGLEDIELSKPDSRKNTQPLAEYMDLIEASKDIRKAESAGPVAEYMDLIEASKDIRKAESAGPVADYTHLHPLTRSWEVSRHHVTIEKEIGKGAFGQVAKGTAVGLRWSPETTTVAIKMLKANATESDKRDLMKELETMKQLKPHPHVIRLLGCVTESEPLLVLIEYVPFGDLLGYLRKSRGLNDTYYKDPDIKPHTNLTSQQLMRFAWQIADGMSYLSSKSIIHRDLAARNVLVGQKETCKVTDFGMARDVQQENIYERKTKGRLPVKWTAYEALLYGKYTAKSDVWSFGVLLYEIFTIGGSPYPRMDGRKIANLLQDGYRMPKPQHVDEKLYKIMMKCWKNDPDARPTFTELKNQLKDMETQHKTLINMTMYDKQLYANVEDLMV